MKTYRVESRVGSMSAILADGCHESRVDYRFVCEGFIVAQFPKAMVRGVSEIPVASTEVEALLGVVAQNCTEMPAVESTQRSAAA